MVAPEGGPAARRRQGGRGASSGQRDVRVVRVGRALERPEPVLAAGVSRSSDAPSIAMRSEAATTSAWSGVLPATAVYAPSCSASTRCSCSWSIPAICADRGRDRGRAHQGRAPGRAPGRDRNLACASLPSSFCILRSATAPKIAPRCSTRVSGRGSAPAPVAARIAASSAGTSRVIVTLPCLVLEGRGRPSAHDQPPRGAGGALRGAEARPGPSAGAERQVGRRPQAEGRRVLFPRAGIARRAGGRRPCASCVAPRRPR